MPIRRPITTAITAGISRAVIRDHKPGGLSFEQLKKLRHPMVVATKGNNPLETGRYPQPTTVLNCVKESQQYVLFDDVTGWSSQNLHVKAICKLDSSVNYGSPIRFQNSAGSTVVSVNIYLDKIRGNFYPDGSTLAQLLLDVVYGEWLELELIFDRDAGEVLFNQTVISTGSTQTSSQSVTFGVLDDVKSLLVGSFGTLSTSGNFGLIEIADYSTGSNLDRIALQQTNGPIGLSGLGHAGTLMNGASWVVDNTLPWQADVTNEEGYTLGTGSNGAAVGVIIPPSTIDPTKDCLGNDLQWAGSVYPVTPADNGPNKNCYQVTELGDYTAATVNLGAADDIADSDTKADVMTATGDRVFKNNTTGEIVAFYDTLTGDDFDKADSYTS